MIESLKQHEIPGRLAIVEGKSGMPAIRIETDWSTAEIYQHGAHVTSFQTKGGAPVLFMSGESLFQSGKAIRGGVPLVYPWFGGREGSPAHGFARLTAWDLLETRAMPGGAVRVRFRLPSDGASEVVYQVTVAAALTLELMVRNLGAEDFRFESCLHTYFNVGSADAIGLHGLAGDRCVDLVAAREFVQGPEPVRITSETDRIYQDSTGEVGIRDPSLGRTIHVRKSGSRSTVVWNPWIDKSIRMADFGDEEYRRMICVESGNVGENAVVLPPGGEAVLRVEIETSPLDG